MVWVVDARGHPNIRATHQTTWQLTKETSLTPSGDCIIAVNASHGAADLDDELKSWLQEGNWVKLELRVHEHYFQGKGQGHPDLSFDNLIDMVFRKSQYTCGRTITINTTFTASNLPRSLVDPLLSPDTQLKLIISRMD